MLNNLNMEALKSKKQILQSVVIFIVIIFLTATLVVFWSCAKRKSDNTKSGENQLSAQQGIQMDVQYNGMLPLTRVVNVHISYRYSTTTQKGNVEAEDYIHLTSLIFPYSVNGKLITKEIPLSNIQEISNIKRTKIDQCPSFTISLKDGDKMDVIRYDLRQIDKNFLVSRFPKLNIDAVLDASIIGESPNAADGYPSEAIFSFSLLCDKGVTLIRFITTDGKKN